MQSLCPLLLLNEIVPFCSVADTLALCDAVMSLKPYRAAALRQALRADCPAKWDLDTFATEEELMCLHQALDAFRALEPAPGAWELPDWCPRPRRVVDITLDLVFYAFDLAEELAAPMEGRGPIAFSAITAGQIVVRAISYATGVDTYPYDQMTTLRLDYDPFCATTTECQRATFAWLATLPARVHAVLPQGAPRVLHRDFATVLVYMAWMDYLEYLRQFEHMWSFNTIEGLTCHKDFMDRACRRLGISNSRAPECSYLSYVRNDIATLYIDSLYLGDYVDTLVAELDIIDSIETLFYDEFPDDEFAYA